MTQLFTLRWIVRFLVENSLGRMWVDMHPDSELADSFEYLVPLEGERQAPLKSVREITLLDPACGTMHFGLVAFDLFVQMYIEEMANAGQPGWPEKSPVQNEDEIASAIIGGNIHGIDIDLRAVQLSGLTLYLKAKTLNPNAELRESRLACADIHMLDGDRLKEFLQQAGLHARPIYGRILSELQQRLKDAEQLGSLLRIEEEIRTLVEQERKRYEEEGRQMAFPGWSEQQFETEAGQREFWETLEIQIGQALDAFAREQAEAGRDHSFFAGETTKGLRLLEVMSGRYDVVVTNPPYMSGRKMNTRLKKLVGDEYKRGKGDLYAAFIQRCLEFAGETGRVGMLTMHSFMFISSYKTLRKQLRGQVCIETLAHAGPALFAVGNPGTLQTAAYVLCRESDAQAREKSVGMYFRLVKEPDAEAKRRQFEVALANLRAGRAEPAVYRYRQGDFDAIPGSPWVYWITPGLRQTFSDCSSLREVAPAIHGTATYDNFRFLRFWWEIGKSRIGFANRSWTEFERNGDSFVPYMKGGPFRRWYGNQQYVVHVARKARVLTAFLDVKGDSIRGMEKVFGCGVTWSDLTSGRFSARLSPGGFIFDVKGSSAFPDDIPLVLGLLNSSFAHYALSLLNPTVSFQVGDLARLPVPDTSSDELRALVEQALELARADSQEDETTWDFIAPVGWPERNDQVERRHSKLTEVEREIDEEVYRLYRISVEDRQAIKVELAEPTTASDEAVCQNENGEEDGSEAATAELTVTREELARWWISYAVGIVMGRFQPGTNNALGRGNFSEEVAAELRSLADADGVMVLDPGHPDDLTAKVLAALQIMLGEAEAREIVAAATGRNGNAEEELRRYFMAKFFKEHIKQYRKRPVYWLFQSPRKKYGVWLFHEGLTKDTLYRIRGEEYVSSKLKLLQSYLAELARKRDGAEGRERRQLEKEIADLEEVLDDVQAFAERIDAILARGYVPHIDDGVLINMAPLWELIPSWQAEPKKCWLALERGDFDWSHQAMDHWPDRVREQCKENRSYAIAHGLVE